MIALSVYNLTKIYDNTFIALNMVNFSINFGDFLAILGRNGAGKSTLIGILTSLIKKTSGKVYVYNYDLDFNYNCIKYMFGIMPQDFNFNQFETVSDIIFNHAGFYGIKRASIFNRVRYLLELFELWDYRNFVSGNLSSGMKRRLMLIRAIVHDPDILILDEPTVGVDIFSRKIMLDFLRDFNKLGKTIILTTHYLEEVENLCNRVAVIDKGFLLKEVFINELQYVFDVKIFIVKVDDSYKLLNSLDLKIKIIDKNSIEFFLFKDQQLDTFFKFVNERNAVIFDMINKTNFLYDFFINILNKDV